MPSNVSASIELFFAKYRTRTYDKGQVLLLNGDKADYIYYLHKGAVKQYDVTYRGDEIILNVFKSGAFFPMSLAINGGISPYIYEAETEIEVSQAPTSDVIAFVQKNPDILLDLLSRVYRGVDGLLGRVVHLMSGTAMTRVMYELVTEARRFGTRRKDGSYMIDVNEKELAARGGLSRETISREIHKLKLEKLIIIESRHIIITDLRQLKKKLENTSF